MVAIGGDAENCSGDRRGFWNCSGPDFWLSCQIDDPDDPERAHKEQFHCHHWYEDQGCCACTVDTMNLLVIESPPEGKVLLASEDASIAVMGMEAYFKFGEKMNWPGLRLSETRVIRNSLRKAINNIKAVLLAE